MINEGKLSVSHNGVNEGAIIGVNTGTINFQVAPKKISSTLSTTIKTLSSACAEVQVDEALDLLEFSPEDKIEYNNIIKYKEIIREHSIYYHYCDDKLNTLDNSNIGLKSKLLQCVRNWYLEARGELLLRYKNENNSNIITIQNNSDHLIDCVKAKMIEIIFNSKNEDILIEEIELGVICFCCYSFMECKILERPK